MLKRSMAAHRSICFSEYVNASCTKTAAPINKIPTPALPTRYAEYFATRIPTFKAESRFLAGGVSDPADSVFFVVVVVEALRVGMEEASDRTRGLAAGFQRGDTGVKTLCLG